MDNAKTVIDQGRDGRCRKAVLLYGACEQNTKAEKDAQTALKEQRADVFPQGRLP